VTRNVALIAVLVAVVITLAFWFLLYQPQNERQAEIEAEIVGLRSEEAALETQVATLRGIQQNEVQIRAALARLDEYIPPNVAQPSALRQLQRTADAAGATLQVLTFGDPARPEAIGGTTALDTGDPTKALAAIPVSIAVDGGYFQIVDFLRRVEVDVPRAVLIQDVSLEKSPDGDFPLLRATFATQLFAIVDADQLPEATAGAAPGGTTGGQQPAGGQPTPTPTPSPTATAAPQ